jgi:hypothetical protein
MQGASGTGTTFSSLSLKPPLYQPPAKKTAARAKTTKTTKTTRAPMRAQAGNWWTVFDRSVWAAFMVML